MSLDQLVANTQQTIAASLREAFNAGRAEAAVELKGRVHALVEELIGAYTTAAPSAAVVAPEHASHGQLEPTQDHQHDAQPDQGHAAVHDQGQGQDHGNQGQHDNPWNQGHQG